jgi:quinol monooxygenase YgiN
MSYVVVRRYSGTGQRSHDEVIQLAGQELWPELKSAGGCQRYTLVKFADNMFGSVSLYEGRAAADRANSIASTWVKSTGAMTGYTLAEVLAGERVFGFNREESFDNTAGVMRIYHSPASTQDVKTALEQEAQPILNESSGLLRYTCFKVDGDDRFVVLTAHKDQASAAQLTQGARTARGKSGSLLAKALPHDPDVIEGHIVRSFAG